MSGAGGMYAEDPARNLDPQTALRALREGNDRFTLGASWHPRNTPTRIYETGKHGQQPFAVVLGCCDSRVPVELVFDQGIGDLYVTRVAGNVCDADEIGSIEFAVDHLHTPLVVVLGHTQCAAVTAVVTGEQLPWSVRALVRNIELAASAARCAHPELRGSDLVTAATLANIGQSIHDLTRGSASVRTRLEQGTLAVVGALYNVESGKVDWLSEPAGPAAAPSAGDSGNLG
jgi:carbonic anhydrase